MKNFERSLDEMTAEEIDLISAELELECALPEDIDFFSIKEKAERMAGIAAKQGKGGLRGWRRVAVIAAILAVMGTTLVACVAEARVYENAVSFFEIYDLSVEGMTRGEIKRVYRDIVTRSFTYEKTAEVIGKRVEGFEVTQKPLSSDEIKRLWNSISQAEEEKIGIRYEQEALFDGPLGSESGTVLKKYDDGRLCWQVECREFEAWGYTEVKGGVIVDGTDETTSSYEQECIWLRMIDESGKVRWTVRMDGGYNDEWFVKLIEAEDGSFTVFSRADLRYLCVRKLDREGNLLDFRQIAVEGGIWDVVSIEDGYVVQFGNYMTQECAKLLILDREANALGEYSYGEEDLNYRIDCVMEHEGRIYLSITAEPKREVLHRTAAFEYGVRWYGTLFWSEKRLTKLVRSEQTALLLACDPVSGKVETFYEVDGSNGGALAHNEAGELLWDVEQVAWTYWSPGTSSFSIGGRSYVFRYCFDRSGEYLSVEKTGELREFRQ